MRRAVDLREHSFFEHGILDRKSLKLKLALCIEVVIGVHQLCPPDAGEITNLSLLTMDNKDFVANSTHEEIMEKLRSYINEFLGSKNYILDIKLHLSCPITGDFPIHAFKSRGEALALAEFRPTADGDRRSLSRLLNFTGKIISFGKITKKL